MNKELWTAIFVGAGCVLFVAGLVCMIFEPQVGAALMLLSAANFVGALMINDFYLKSK
jgi:hypothetical protein